MFITLDPNVRAARTLIARGHIEQALNTIHAIAFRSRRWRARAWAAETLHRLGHTAMARDEWVALIGSMRQAGELRAALTTCARCIKRYGADCQWETLRAALLLDLERVREARAALHQAWMLARPADRPRIARLTESLPIAMAA